MRCALLTLVALAVACVDSHPAANYCAAEPNNSATQRPVTYHADIAPLIARKCLVCHEGGSGTAKFSTYAQLFELREAVVDAVKSQRMPPWPPAVCCNEFKDPLALSADERAMLFGWVAQGAPQGTATTAAPLPGRTGLPRVDASLVMPAPYTPSPPVGGTDDTRCFLLDVPADETLFVTGIDIRPGVSAQMHHALVLTVGASDAERLRKQDAQTEAPGWPCPGGAFGGLKGWLGGSFYQAQVYPAGTGHLVEPGDKVVLTMHYSRPPSGELVPDTTTLQFMFEREPQTRLLSLPVLNPAWTVGAMRLPANEVTRVSYVDDPVAYNGNRPLTVVAVNLHMHERGRRGQVAVLRADGTRECLLQIDDWRHEWQGDFTLQTPSVLNRGDSLLVECQFDNGPDRQRIVAGARQTPRDLNWGEDQEMCIAFVTAIE